VGSARLRGGTACSAGRRNVVRRLGPGLGALGIRRVRRRARPGRLVDSCIAVYPIDRRLWLVPEEDRSTLYSYDLTVLRRCLLAHGQRVPRMPSRVRFENLMRASAPWNGYDLVVVKNRAAWYALSDACPALPPGIAADVTTVSASG
jgi:hypothetical protein